jgi:hypothetical protein
LGGSWNNGTENPGIYGGPQTGAPVPLSEDTESYDVDIIKAVSGVDTVVRTFVGLTSPTVVYSAAQQTTDFGAPVTSLHVKVYQNSAQVGRGFVADIPNVLAGHGTISGSVDASSINGVNVIGTPGVDGEVLTYVAANADLEWLLPSQPRAIFTKTTGSLASGAVEQSTIGMTKTFLLLKVTANKPCRLQLYSTAAAATADALRPVGVIPSGQHGVIADVSLETDTTEAWALSTFTIGSNLETSPSSNITYRITNDDSTTGTITINITIVPIER